MKTLMFYHVYLDDLGHWSFIVNEQLSCAENQGLLNNIDEMYVTCVSNDYYKTKWFSLLVQSYFKKAVIEEVIDPFSTTQEMLDSYPNFTKNGSKGNNTETYTLKKIYDVSQKEDAKIFYTHDRGISFSIRTFQEAKNGNTKWIYDNQYQKLTYLSRQFLNWGTIENWQKMATALDKYDTAGCSYQLEPMPNYMGNIWWSKSSYIRSLPDPGTIDWWRRFQDNLPDGHSLKSGFSASDRFRDEFWLNSNTNGKFYNIIDLLPEQNPLKHIVRKETYADKKQNPI